MKRVITKIMDHLLGTIKTLSKAHVENRQRQYLCHLESRNVVYCMDGNSQCTYHQIQAITPILNYLPFN